VQQVRKLVVVVHVEHVAQDGRLHVRLMHARAPAADLAAVQHQVIVLARDRRPARARLQ